MWLCRAGAMLSSSAAVEQSGGARWGISRVGLMGFMGLMAEDTSYPLTHAAMPPSPPRATRLLRGLRPLSVTHLCYIALGTSGRRSGSLVSK